MICAAIAVFLGKARRRNTHSVAMVQAGPFFLPAATREIAQFPFFQFGAGAL
jgi:hypothetical protein